MSIHLGGVAAQFRLVRRFIDECPDNGRRWRRREFGRRLTTRRLALSGAGRARFISLNVVGLPRRSPVGHHLAILCCREKWRRLRRRPSSFGLSDFGVGGALFGAALRRFVIVRHLKTKSAALFLRRFVIVRHLKTKSAALFLRRFVIVGHLKMESAALFLRRFVIVGHLKMESTVLRTLGKRAHI